MTQIPNEWITLEAQRNGVTVQRAMAGFGTAISEPNESGMSEVSNTIVPYWERELYPNGEVIKTEYKHYKIEDLAETVNDVEHWTMAPLAVLSGYVSTVGMPYIVTPARETLISLAALPLNAPNGYVLRSETREKIHE